jgi:hypothetical protein
MLELLPAPAEPLLVPVRPVALPAPLPVPVLPPVVPLPDVPVDDPPAPLVALPPAILPVTSTRCPTYCFRFWLSPPVSR